MISRRWKLLHHDMSKFWTPLRPQGDTLAGLETLSRLFSPLSPVVERLAIHLPPGQFIEVERTNASPNAGRWFSFHKFLCLSNQLLRVHLQYAFSVWKSPQFGDFKWHRTQNPTTGARKDWTQQYRSQVIAFVLRKYRLYLSLQNSVLRWHYMGMDINSSLWCTQVSGHYLECMTILALGFQAIPVLMVHTSSVLPLIQSLIRHSSSLNFRLGVCDLTLYVITISASWCDKDRCNATFFLCL